MHGPGLPIQAAQGNIMKIRALALVAAMVAVSTLAVARQNAPQTPQSRTTASQAQAATPVYDTGYYVNSTGAIVHRPERTMRNVVPAGASAQCRDGTYSFSQHRRGTCSRHGGVARWL